MRRPPKDPGSAVPRPSGSCFDAVKRRERGKLLTEFAYAYNVNAATGLALSAVIGVLAGLIPATMAARLKIVDALRRVA